MIDQSLSSTTTYLLMIISFLANFKSIPEISFQRTPYLPACSSFHHCHDDVLRGHERQLLFDVFLYDARVDDEALGDVLQGAQGDVSSQERLRKTDTPVNNQKYHKLSKI